MTLEEAAKIAKVISHADSGCPTCVGDLVDDLNKEFLEFHWELVKPQYDEEGDLIEEQKCYWHYGYPVSVRMK